MQVIVIAIDIGSATMKLLLFLLVFPFPGSVGKFQPWRIVCFCCLVEKEAQHFRERRMYSLLIN